MPKVSDLLNIHTAHLTSPLLDRTVRKEFINAKYVDHKYARKTCTSAAAKMIELFEAVQSRDLLALIQVYAEGVELMEPLPEVGPVSPFC